MLKTIWDTVTGNYRYIKHDGSEFHRGKITSIIDRPEMKVGLACFAFNCAAILVQQNDLVDVISGNFDYISQLTKQTLEWNVKDFITGITLCPLLSQAVLYNIFPKKGFAIDTHGRDLSRAQLSLRDLNNLENVRYNGGIFAALGLNSIVLDLLGNTPKIASSNAILFTMGLIAFERSHKIIKGDYVICGTPPKKRQTAKSKSSIFGGVTNPS